jgi:PP-loop superfamily ATP-utilizing enzyme
MNCILDIQVNLPEIQQVSKEKKEFLSFAKDMCIRERIDFTDEMENYIIKRVENFNEVIPYIARKVVNYNKQYRKSETVIDVTREKNAIQFKYEQSKKYKTLTRNIINSSLVDGRYNFDDIYYGDYDEIRAQYQTDLQLLEARIKRADRVVI